jgi:hypothetical protein
LSARFSPSTLRLRAGQQFLVIVAKDVRVTGLSGSGSCGPGVPGEVTGGLLSARCAAGGYLYTAVRAGSATLSATAGPRCEPGTMCPQWVTEPTLKITIT